MNCQNTPHNILLLNKIFSAQVHNFGEICKEVLRILKPGGELIASFNINEPESNTEPQCLTEQIIKEKLLNKMDIKSYRLSHKQEGNPYQGFFDGSDNYVDGEIGILWIRAVKRQVINRQ